MARYSDKGHDTIRYNITQNIAIRYDTMRSKSASLYVRTACCQLQTTAISSPLPPFLLHSLAPLKLDTRRPPTSRAAPLDSAGVSQCCYGESNQNRSLVTSRRHRQRDVLNLKRHGVCAFLFFDSVHYVYYLLLDHVIRSSAINLHLFAFDLEFAHHRCQVSGRRRQ